MVRAKRRARHYALRANGKKEIMIRIWDDGRRTEVPRPEERREMIIINPNERIPHATHPYHPHAVRYLTKRVPGGIPNRHFSP